MYIIATWLLNFNIINASNRFVYSVMEAMYRLCEPSLKLVRKFIPNLKKVTFRSDILKKDIKLNVANAALRTVDFKGGLDRFLISAKNAKLSKKVKKIKASISAKS